jgi:hypothetical protein
MPNTAFPAADQQHLIYGISETRVFSAQEPAPWMSAANTDVVIAVHESATAAAHDLAERQRLRALYSGGGRWALPPPFRDLWAGRGGLHYSRTRIYQTGEDGNRPPFSGVDMRGGGGF